ncbi:MAG: hypothetical protein KGL39_18200 [Patescibacteria group bacterium]|nr:hypothetical protein [Patescibacteria group bacterium]
MKVISTDARAFVTIDENWEGDLPEGAFVRFKPGAKDTDLSISQKKAMFEAMGAIVKVLPKEAEEAVIAPATKITASSPRETVYRLIEDSNEENKPLLKGFCDAVMEKCSV